MAEVARPAADAHAGNYTDEIGGASALYQQLNESVADDADYVRSPLAPTQEAYVCKLASLADPNASSGHTVRYRYAKAPAGGAAINVKVQLRQGYVDESTDRGTLIAEWSHSDIGDTVAQANQVLTSEQADAITDYTDLYLRFVANPGDDTDPTPPGGGDPGISSITGTIGDGNSVTVNGAGFGTRTEPKPLLWAPFAGSLNPSALGVVTAWADNENMVYDADEGPTGGGCAKGTPNAGNWTLRIDAPDGLVFNAWGQKLYVFRKTKVNFDVDGLNWKTMRCWAANFSAPDWYIATGHSAGQVTVEGISSLEGHQVVGELPSPDTSATLEQLRGTVNQYNTEEVIIRTADQGDELTGLCKVWVNGINCGGPPYFDYAQKAFVARSSDTGQDMVLFFPVHGVIANHTFAGGENYWAADVYVDTTWQRVMIGDAATWSACVHKEIQIPTSWSDTAIDIVMRRGEFANFTGTYLYVIDENNDPVDPNGYPLS